MKAWVLALRPKTLSAAFAPVAAGTALALGRGETVLWWAAACALASACFIQIGTNLVNDALDFRKGADDRRRIGPTRVTQSGLLSERAVLAGGFACFAIAAALGVPLALEGGWPIVAIGLISLFCGYAYTGGPFPLAYVGLGDLFVVVFFGLVAVGGTRWLHAKSFGVESVVAGLQVGFLATVLIAINNLRDAPVDGQVGKRTLAVRLGPSFARWEIAFMAFAPFAFGAYWATQGRLWAAGIPLATVPLAIGLVRGVFAHEPSPIYNGFLARAAGLQIAFCAALSIGLALP